MSTICKDIRQHADIFSPEWGPCKQGECFEEKPMGIGLDGGMISIFGFNLSRFFMNVAVIMMMCAMYLFMAAHVSYSLAA